MPAALLDPVLDSFLDLVAGGCCVACRRPGRRLCGWCGASLRPQVARVRPTPCPPGLLPVHAAGDYAGTLRALVIAHKERTALGLAEPLGRLLADVVAEACRHAALRPAPSGPVVLVPVPSHPAVVRSRGHDPLLRVVRRCARVLRRRGTAVRVRRLLRVVGRPQDQAGLSAGQRRSNLEGRFLARRAPDGWQGVRQGVRLLLVDDVMTTGATLREAQRALEHAGWIPEGAVTLAATRRRAAR